MASTVRQGFDTFLRNLETTDLQSGTASGRQTAVRGVVAESLTVETSFLTGSYMRNTMIAPLKEADIDIFVVLDDLYYSSNK
jgi:tRNA nucleotidyltransferase (CCA-adding enzyme)